MVKINLKLNLTNLLGVLNKLFFLIDEMVRSPIILMSYFNKSMK